MGTGVVTGYCWASARPMQDKRDSTWRYEFCIKLLVFDETLSNNLVALPKTIFITWFKCSVSIIFYFHCKWKIKNLKKKKIKIEIQYKNLRDILYKRQILN